MTRIVETAFAKVNLALHVRARRDDGYHDIETVFAFADDGDKVSVEPAEDMQIEVFGPYAEGVPADETNLAVRAARAMQAHFKVGSNVRIRIAKMLPVAAGVGGGSADAGAVARGLNQLWELNAPEPALIEAVRPLGADVAACVGSRTVIGRGRGDILEATPLEKQLAGTPVLLANPGASCPTGPVYKGWDGIDRGSLAILRNGWRNDLTPSAVALVPEIGMALFVLAELEGTTQVALSGSGATCFALFGKEGDRDAALASLRETHPDWWVMTGRLR